jgi:hypothetical protein
MIKPLIYLTLMALSLGLSACSTFSRSDSSGYIDESDDPSTAKQFFMEKGNQKFENAKEELGYTSGRPLNENEAAAVFARVELNRLEGTLSYDQEKKQYYSLKPFFNNDLERIYFLRLPDKEARARWAANKGVTSNETQFDPVVTGMIEKNDISKGMSREAVKQSWGEPEFVDVAGNSIYGNERWRYNKLVSTDEGYKSETRIIYFESGRVTGWETL